MADDIAALCEEHRRTLQRIDDGIWPPDAAVDALRVAVEALERVTTERDAEVEARGRLKRLAAVVAERDAARLEAEQASDRATGYARELYQLRLALCSRTSHEAP